MRYSFFTTLVLGLANLAAATILSPRSGDSWHVGSDHEIMWDTTGLTGPCDIHLVPAGATDISVIITEIVKGTGNTGSYHWAPDKSIAIIKVAIIIVDAKKIFVKSEDFILIIEEGTLLTSTKKTSSTVKTSIKTTALTLSTSKALTSPVLTKTTLTALLATSIKTTALSTSTKPTTVAVALTSSTTKATINTATLTTPAILSVATFKPLNSTTLKVTSATILSVMTTSKPLTTSTALKPTTTTITSVASPVKQNATTSATKAVFTGAAAHGSSNVYSLVSGGVVGAIAMFFL